MKGFTPMIVPWLGSCCVLSVAAASAPASTPRLHPDAALPAVAVAGDKRTHTLPQWMDLLGVPGFSAVVIDDYRIDTVIALGNTATEAGGVAVTPDTRFQAASIAKAITAIVVMHEAAKGSVDLDADINTQLVSFQLPRDAALETTPVTLRHLLAHTAGVTEGGFPGYARDTELPTLGNILRGEPPATNRPARVTKAPGTEVAYSGLGYTVIQQWIEDRHKRPFQDVVDRTLFKPLGVTHTTFDHRIAESDHTPIARGHLANGLPLAGGWHVFPEQAAAGLWTTSSDLAAIVIDVANAWRGKKATVVSEHTARHLLDPVQGTMGHGVVVREDNPHAYFAHSGGNPGYYAHFRMLAGTGDGVVILTNAESGALLAPLWMAAVAEAYEWPATERFTVNEAQTERLAAQVAHIRDGAAKTRVARTIDPEILKRYVGAYELAPGMLFDITWVGGQLNLRLGDQPKFPILAESETAFFLEAVDAAITFEVDAEGQPTALILHQGGRDQRAPRVVVDTP